MDKTIKLAMFTDEGDCSREDVNQLIAALVRIGYEIYMDDNHICFKLGNDDEIKEVYNES